MTSHRSEARSGRPRNRSELGLRLYWLVVTVLSLALLGATINVATPRDAADLVQAHTAP